MDSKLSAQKAFWVLTTAQGLSPTQQAAIDTALGHLTDQTPPLVCPKGACKHYLNNDDQCETCHRQDHRDHFTLSPAVNRALFLVGDLFLAIELDDIDYVYTLYDKFMAPQESGDVYGCNRSIQEAALDVAFAHRHGSCTLAQVDLDTFLRQVHLLDAIQASFPGTSGGYCLEIAFPQSQRPINWIPLLRADDLSAVLHTGEQIMAAFGPQWLRVSDSADANGDNALPIRKTASEGSKTKATNDGQEVSPLDWSVEIPLDITVNCVKPGPFSYKNCQDCSYFKLKQQSKGWRYICQCNKTKALAEEFNAIWNIQFLISKGTFPISAAPFVDVVHVKRVGRDWVPQH